MDVELIDTIKATVFEIWKIKNRIRELKKAGKPVPKYLQGYIRRLDTNLNKMRSVAVYYREYSSIENLQTAGRELHQADEARPHAQDLSDIYSLPAYRHR